MAVARITSCTCESCLQRNYRGSGQLNALADLDADPARKSALKYLGDEDCTQGHGRWQPPVDASFGGGATNTCLRGQGHVKRGSSVDARRRAASRRRVSSFAGKRPNGTSSSVGYAMPRDVPWECARSHARSETGPPGAREEAGLPVAREENAKVVAVAMETMSAERQVRSWKHFER